MAISEFFKLRCAYLCLFLIMKNNHYVVTL